MNPELVKESNSLANHKTNGSTSQNAVKQARKGKSIRSA